MSCYDLNMSDIIIKVEWEESKLFVLKETKEFIAVIDLQPLADTKNKRKEYSYFW